MYFPKQKIPLGQWCMYAMTIGYLFYIYSPPRDVYILITVLWIMDYGLDFQALKLIFRAVVLINP